MIKMDLIPYGKNEHSLLINQKPELKVPDQSLPPCPNGCGNEDTHQVKKSRSGHLNMFDERGNQYQMKTRINFFSCERCLSLFYIKIQEMPEELVPAESYSEVSAASDLEL